MSNNSALNTPMMQQYLSIKEMHKEYLLFYRLGDFFELFFDDALIASRELDIVLTRRGKTEGHDIPMCGVPAHSCEFYLNKLLKSGHGVAICEQLESPEEAKKRGYKSVVRREVVRIITPGTVLEEKLLHAKELNYLVAIHQHKRDYIAVSWTELSIGSFFVEYIPVSALYTELARLSPREIVLSDKLFNTAVFRDNLDSKYYLSKRPDSIFDSLRCSNRLKKFFGLEFLEGMGDFNDAEIIASGALLEYVEHTQKDHVPIIQKLRRVEIGYFMSIDPATRINLELEKDAQGKRENSLLAVLDQTITAPGGRILAYNLNAPLTDIAAINHRLDNVQSLTVTSEARTAIRKALSSFADLERIISRVSAKRAHYNDLIMIGQSLKVAVQIAEMLYNYKLSDGIYSLSKQIVAFDGLITELMMALNFDMMNFMRTSLNDKKAHNINKNGGNQSNGVGNKTAERGDAENIVDDESCDLNSRYSAESISYIKAGYHPQLDKLYQLKYNVDYKINELKAKYKAISGISSLKITKNNILGYFIDVTPGQASKMQHNCFILRQSLASSVRYTSEELKNVEADVLLCNERIEQLEQEIFNSLCDKVLQRTEQIVLTAKSIGELDMYCSLAEIAHKHNYVRPVLVADSSFSIKSGKHPVIMNKLGSKFTPNSCVMTDPVNQLHLIAENSHETVKAKKRISSGQYDQNDSGIKVNYYDAMRNCGHMWLITGPNMAGKSTFLRQNALLCIMAQIGSFIPAEQACIGIVDKIFSRIGASDNIAHGQSTFMVEMLETANILNNATRRSFLILDEVGRGTTTHDGLAIAAAVVENIAESIGARTLFATHYHELTALSDRMPEKISCHAMKVEEWDGKIVFMHEVVPGKADKSYGIHVAALAGMPQKVITRAQHILDELENSLELR